MAFGFTVEFNNVYRDFVQGKYGNRPPLNSKIALELFALQEELTKSYNPSSAFKPGAIEVGGAQPQVDVIFLGRDFTETLRQIREAAPTTPIRPLWRALNGFMLKPHSEEELTILLKQLAEDCATPQDKNLLAEMLRLKIFDSQGDMQEVEQIVKNTKTLIDAGFPVTIEIAIPYSNGKDGLDLKIANTYPDDFYLRKMDEAIALMVGEYQIPQNLLRLSLKDMAGEMDSETATRLVPQMIAKLKAANLNEVPIGLHLHDTGLAQDAYAAAIKICQKQNWAIAVDTVAFEKNKGYETGFVNSLDLIAAVKKEGIDLGISKEQETVMQKMGASATQTAASYQVNLAPEKLSGADLRKYRIPGGGFASLYGAVKSHKFERMGENGKKEAVVSVMAALDLSEEEALHVAGNALIAASRLMGHPFSVTPGFQNKQIAAFHLLSKMYENRLIFEGMSLQKLQEIILTPLTNDQVKNLFVKNLNPVVADFIKGNLPVVPHPEVQAAFPKRAAGIVSNQDKISNLKDGQKKIAELFDKGLIIPSLSQGRKILKQVLEEDKIEDVTQALLAKNLLHEGKIQTAKNNWEKELGTELQNWGITLETATKITQNLKEKTLESHLAFAIINGVNHLARLVENPWYHEPDAANFDQTKYGRYSKRFGNGLSGKPNVVDSIREQVETNEITLKEANKRVGNLVEIEKLNLRLFFENFVKDQSKRLVGAISDEVKNDQSDRQNLRLLVKDLYQSLEKNYNQNAGKEGVKPLYSLDQTIDACLNSLAELVIKKSKTKNPNHKKAINENIATFKKVIESSAIKAPMSGQILHLNKENGSVWKIGDTVKAGDSIAVLDAMKMEHKVNATYDGKILTINFAPNSAVKNGETIMGFLSDEAAKYQELDKNIKQKTVFSHDESELHQHLLAESDQNKIAAENAKNELEEITSDYPSSPTSSLPSPLTDLEKIGYNHARPLQTKVQNPITLDDKEDNTIHVVGNRAGCGVKIAGDLMQAKAADIRILWKNGDASTAIVANIAKDKKIAVKSYMNQEEIIKTLNKISNDNPGKKILFHPGWGFLSEKDDFVATMEKTFKNQNNVIFVGPKSQPMQNAGNKFNFRKVVQTTKNAEELNPPFFEGNIEDLSQLENYCRNPQTLNPLHAIYQAQFKEIKKMGGDVRIKAVSGGGGRGIAHYQIDPNKNDEQNYQSYLNLTLETKLSAEKLFNDPTVLVEKSILGKAHHVEIQFAASKAGAMTLGGRICTPQQQAQKYVEMNILEGDYSPELMQKINKATGAIAVRLAQDGYEGIGTLEMMVIPKSEEVYILETNTRLQVEHSVTEEDIFLKSGIRISLPLLNAQLIANPDKTPQEILSKTYSLSNEQLETIGHPAQERVTHFRINSKDINLETGEAVPSWVEDDMWLSGITAKIAKDCNVSIIQGGIGDGTSDPQIGAIFGKGEDVKKAAKQLDDAFTIAAYSERNHQKTNIESIFELLDAIFNENGTVRKEFSTTTTDDLLQSIKNGKMEVTKKQTLDNIEAPDRRKTDSQKLLDAALDRKPSPFVTLAQNAETEKLLKYSTNIQVQ